MNKSETVEIKKHGNTYEDITFCPECGCKDSDIIKKGEFGHDTFIFDVYGDGKVYKCKECGCEYLICKTDQIKLRQFEGFASVVCGILGFVFAIACLLLLLSVILPFLNDSDKINFMQVFIRSAATLLSAFLSGYFFYASNMF